MDISPTRVRLSLQTLKFKKSTKVNKEIVMPGHKKENKKGKMGRKRTPATSKKKKARNTMTVRSKAY